MINLGVESEPQPRRLALQETAWRWTMADLGTSRVDLENTDARLGALDQPG